MKTGRRKLLLMLGVAAVSICAEADGATQATGSASAADVCRSLDGRSRGGAEPLHAVMIAATASTPAYCKVAGVIAPRLNFELRIPGHWNGKLYYQGGGGFDGAVNPLDAYVPSGAALARGYVVVASDSGHQAAVTDASWALNDPTAARLWGGLSVPTVMSAARKIVRAAYGRRPAKSYFEGCSNGGREGLMAIERNPDLFDGVIVRAPAFNATAVFGHWSANIRALAAPGAALSNAKVATLAKAVRDRCDTLDGLADGLISDPSACEAAFDVSTLRCPAWADTGDGCLSDAQLTAIKTVLTPATFSSGTAVYRDAGRLLTGNEDDPHAWAFWITGDGDVRKALSFAFVSAAIKAFIARDAATDSLAYGPYDRDKGALRRFAWLADATSTDIRPFVHHGGKVIFWHGGNDGAFSPASTADYVKGVVRGLGGPARAEESLRFYVAPGVDHCSGGPGADRSDLLAALDDWVTDNKAPETLLATKLDTTGAVQFERPLCRYPLYARYVGRAGDLESARSASSFVCAKPQGHSG